jgi:hypothetical protein
MILYFVTKLKQTDRRHALCKAEWKSEFVLTNIPSLEFNNGAESCTVENNFYGINFLALFIYIYLARYTALKIDYVVICLLFAVNMVRFGSANTDEFTSV